MILGPDLNSDGQQDLWVSDQRNNRIVGVDPLTGVLLGKVSIVGDVNGVEVGVLQGESHGGLPTDIDYGPDGSILITTCFASRLDPDWTGSSDVAGGDLIKIVWDSVRGKYVATLLFQETATRGRLDSVACIIPPWPPDFFHDSVIDGKDLNVLASNWLLSPPIDPNVDLFYDGKVDFKDFTEFGKCWRQHQP
jgi:hypothetical protein